MTLRAGIASFVAAAVCLAAPAGAAPLTVRDCVRIARERAPEVRVAGAMRESARQDSLLHAFDLRPAFSLFGGATVAPRGFYDPTTTDLGGYELKTGMEWPLRDGGLRARERRRAAYGAQGALLDQRLAVRDAGLKAGALALSELKLLELAGLQREALGWFDRLAVTLAAGARAGTRGRADAQRAVLEHDDAASELLASERAAASVARELARWLALPPDSIAELATASTEAAAAEDADPAPTRADSLALLERFAGSPEIAQARLEARRSELDLDQARRRNTTQWTLAFDAGLAGADLTSSVPEELRATDPDATFRDRLRRDLGASAALRFTRPLADPSAPHDVAGRTAALSAATLRAESVESAARRAALEVLDRWRDAARRLVRVRASAALAEENLLRLRSLQASGAAPLLELLDARRVLDDARARSIEARFDLRLAKLEAEER